MSNKIWLATSLTLLLSACGGGGSSETGTTPPPDITPPPPPVTKLSGKFVDSGVAGLKYSSASTSGTTGAAGEFEFIQGEEVSFYIGDSLIGKAQGNSLITPLELFATTELSNTAVLNLARLLQTLDADGDPDNGIEISTDTANVISSAAPNGLDFSQQDFAADQTLQSILATLAINQLVSPTQAYEHLSQSLSSNFAEAQRALPIPAFNAHVTGVNYYSNVYTPVDENEDNGIFDTLGEGFTSPRYALPYGMQPFYDFSQADKTASGIGIKQSYVWVDDALSEQPQLRIKLFGLDRTKLLDEVYGLGLNLLGSKADGSEYKVTLVVDPEDWYATILVDGQVLWDEVAISGDYNGDADKTSLWLPLEALQLKYADLLDWQKVSLEFFLFDLQNIPEDNISEQSIVVKHYFPPIVSSFEQPKTWQSDKIHLNFSATNLRTEFPYDEYDTGCRFTTEMTYSGDISWQETNTGSLQWPTNASHFEGSMSYAQKPDMINYDGTPIPCADTVHYSTDNLFNMRKGQSQLTLHDVVKLFTPLYNETWWDNAQTLVPHDVISDPDAHITAFSVDPVTQTIALSGQSRCGAILNCYSDEDDLFDWTMTLSPATE